MTRQVKFLAGCLVAVVAIMVPLRAAAQDAAAPFKKEEIEQLVAPIALYPDALVAQILMASTYPLEVVEAARWSKANPKVTGKALEDAMQKQKWDPAVKSLTAFPQVLAGMNEKLDLTQKLGDAFLGQQKEVMEAIQRLRAKAQSAGNLKSSKEQNVTSAQEGGQTVIKIEPADPQVVYVPSYNPTTVYGPWPYPAYPPYYYYPPGAALFTFAAGVAIGSALWGGCNWGGNNVYINHNNYNNFNRTNISGNQNWQHNSEHRRGQEYRDKASQDKFGRGQRQDAAARDQFRGRAEQGRQDIGRGAADDFKTGGDRAGDRAGGRDAAGARDRAGGAGDRAGAADRAGGRDVGGGDRAGGRDIGGADRGGGGRGGGGFDGVGGGGGSTRDFSSRGASSRASAGASRGGGGGRSGGGGRGGRR